MLSGNDDADICSGDAIGDGAASVGGGGRFAAVKTVAFVDGSVDCCCSECVESAGHVSSSGSYSNFVQVAFFSNGDDVLVVVWSKLVDVVISRCFM